MKNLRGGLGVLMLAGFPAWMYFWMQSPNVLVFLYAVVGYAVLAAILFAKGME